MSRCDRTDVIKKEFPQILKKNLGIVTSACKAAGITRDTYYRWYKDPEFYEACQEAYEERIDFAESKLLKRIESEDTTAIIFFLKTIGRERGYSEKHEHVHYGDRNRDSIMQDVTHTLGEGEQALVDQYFQSRLAKEKHESITGSNTEEGSSSLHP